VWALTRPDDSPTAADQQPSAHRSKRSTSPKAQPSSDEPSSDQPSSDASSTEPAPEETTPTATDPGPANDGDEMTTFVEDYISTALADPSAAWDMLTPRFQRDCCHGEGGYAGYWETIADATLHDVAADPESMQVSYTITWDPVDRPPEDAQVTLVLVRRGDGYLIDQEL
jgi:hypothetical protein